MGRRLSGSVKGCQHERPLPRREIEINVRGCYFSLISSSILVAASMCNEVESSGLCFSPVRFQRMTYSDAGARKLLCGQFRQFV
jgi:hypothetical protein